MRLLLVEDEVVVRWIMSESLHDAGFDVIEAATGDQALQLIRDSPLPFTGLVTDLHMPGSSDGSRVAACMRRRWPSIPVIIVTARPDIFRPGEKDELGYNLLRKPFTPYELVSLVERLLNTPAGD